MTDTEKYVRSVLKADPDYRISADDVKVLLKESTKLRKKLGKENK